MSDLSKLEPDKQLAEENNDSLSEKTAGKGIFNLIGAILLCLAVVGLIVWIRFSTDQKAAELQEKKNQEATAKQEAKTKSEREDSEKEQNIKDALQTFISSNYKGWRIDGKSLIDNSADNIAEYNLNLVEGNKNKIITVDVEKFEKEDGDEYWLAFQPSEYQQLELQIKAVKNKVSEIERNDEKDTPNTDDDSNNQ